MAINVGALFASLTLQSTQFQLGIGRAVSASNFAASAIGSALSRAGGIGSAALNGIGLAGIGTVAGLAAAAKGALDFAASLGEVAQQTGTTVEQYQILSRGAIGAGASQEALDGALKKLNTTLGEAQGGSESAIKAFGQLGISKAQIDSFQQGGDVIPYMMEGMKGLDNTAQQAAAGSGLVGKKISELLPLLQGGAAGYNAMANEAYRAGLLTAEQSAKADEASDTMDLLARTMKTRLAIALSENIGLVMGMINGLATLIDWAGRAASAFARASNAYELMQSRKQAEYGLTQGIRDEGASEVARLLKERKEARVPKVSRPKAIDIPVITPNFDLSSPSKVPKIKTPKAKKEVDPLKQAKDMVASLKFETEQLSRTSKEQEVYNNLKQAGVPLASAFGKQIAELTKELGVAKEWREYNDGLKEYIKNTREATELVGLEGFDLELKQLEQKFGVKPAKPKALGATTGPLDPEEILVTGRRRALFEQAREELEAKHAAIKLDKARREAIERSDDYIKDQKEARKRAHQEQLEQAAELGEAYANLGIETFDALMKGTKSWGDAMRDVVTGIGDLMLETMVYEPLREMARNWAKGLLTGGAQASGGGGFLGSIAGALGGLFGGKPAGATPVIAPVGKAGGGAYEAHRPYWVGEKGPELVVPSTSGSIVPNHRLDLGRRGGPQITIHVNGSSNPAETKRMVQEGILAALPVITEASHGKTMKKAGRPRLN